MTKRSMISIGFIMLLTIVTVHAVAETDACGKTMTPEQKIQRALDVQAVTNVASRHEYYHSALMHAEEFRDIWAQNTAGVSWTNNTDRYVGVADLKRFMIDGLPKDKTGILWVHNMSTPVIEIAGDGKTAKGVWFSAGTVSGSMGGTPMAAWTSEKYGIDFVKENGKWKIWHLHTFVDYYTPTDKRWIDEGGNMNSREVESKRKDMENKLQTGVKEEPGVSFDAMRPTERGEYYIGYDLKTVPVMAPKPPEPYCSFDKATSF